MAGLHSAYLTGRQLGVWSLMRQGLSQSEIARRMDISRQAVNQLVQTIPSKISAALFDAAKLNEVHPTMIDTSRGVLLGFSKELQLNVVITMHPETGLRIWYKHNLGRCKICPTKKQCMSSLLQTVDALGVSLTAEEKRLEPSKLSSLAFSRAFGLSF